MRLQLALNVTVLGAAIYPYSNMFVTAHATSNSGYANFATEHPPLPLPLSAAR